MGIGGLPLDQKDAVFRAATLGLRVIPVRVGNLETFVSASYMIVLVSGTNPFAGLLPGESKQVATTGHGTNLTLGLQRLLGAGPGFYTCLDAGITVLEGTFYPAFDLGVGASF